MQALKDLISPGKLRAIERVEAFIAANPQCSAQQIGTALAIKAPTLNNYTLLLRELGRIRMERAQGGVTGSHLGSFEVVPGRGPLATDVPLPAPQRPHKRSQINLGAPPQLAPPQRAELDAYLFGPPKGKA
jgi:hypothetical protein